MRPTFRPSPKITPVPDLNWMPVAVNNAEWPLSVSHPILIRLLGASGVCFTSCSVVEYILFLVLNSTVTVPRPCVRSMAPGVIPSIVEGSAKYSVNAFLFRAMWVVAAESASQSDAEILAKTISLLAMNANSFSSDCLAESAFFSLNQAGAWPSLPPPFTQQSFS